MAFRLRNLQGLGNRISISIPRDPDGFYGRECPKQACDLYFKIKPGTGLTGQDLNCFCPYCGHQAKPKQFHTEAQKRYAKSLAIRQVSDAVGRDLKQLESRSRRGSLLGFSVTVRHGNRPPIAYYRERILETHLTCSSCTLEYAVFGLFAFCPDCGRHNSVDILQANLALVRKQVTLALAQDDLGLRRHLLEDALENCVSAFDGFGREAVRVAHRGAGISPNISFQNLDRAADRIKQLHQVDMRSAVPPEEWARTRRSFMKRHLFSHRAGVIDDQYLAETGDGRELRGHRVGIDQAEVEATVGVLGRLGEWLVSKICQDAR